MVAVVVVVAGWWGDPPGGPRPLRGRSSDDLCTELPATPAAEFFLAPRRTACVGAEASTSASLGSV